MIITHALTVTAGDYFTVHRCPFTQRETLCLWELKTGYPKTHSDPDTMTIPMPPLPGQTDPEPVPLTSVNRYYLQVSPIVLSLWIVISLHRGQVLLTQMAYERELGLHVDGTVRVINVYRERGPMPKSGKAPVYTCKVDVIGPDNLTPKGWPNRVLKDQLYQNIKKH